MRDCGQELFILKFLLSVLCSSSKTIQWNQPWHTPCQYSVLDKGSKEKIRRQYPVVKNPPVTYFYFVSFQSFWGNEPTSKRSITLKNYFRDTDKSSCISEIYSNILSLNFSINYKKVGGNRSSRTNALFWWLYFWILRSTNCAKSELKKLGLF